MKFMSLGLLYKFLFAIATAKRNYGHINKMQ